jgi:hypothetical protein
LILAFVCIHNVLSLVIGGFASIMPEALAHRVVRCACRPLLLITPY